MTGCFSWLFVLSLAILSMVSLIRWFEQITDAVDRNQWSRVTVLLLMPFMVWLFESRVAAGRPTAVPHREPIRGFGMETKPPPAKKKKRGAIDPEAIAKLKKKMKDQGMIEDE